MRRKFEADCGSHGMTSIWPRAGQLSPGSFSESEACASLLVVLDVHPRVAMQILRHSQIAVTMDIYSQVTSDSTLCALKRLGEELERR
jgi:hypothetical protein